MTKPGDEQTPSPIGSSPMTLALGPLLFNWPPARRRGFYMRIADEAPFEIVCLGEVVRWKRHPLFTDKLPDVVERLQRAGKTVIFSGLALPTLSNELKFCALLARCPQMIKVNDVSTPPHPKGQAHAIGPLINVYNEAAARGAHRIWSLPYHTSSRIAFRFYCFHRHSRESDGGD